MEPFNLQEYLKNPNVKLKTRCGLPVKILSVYNTPSDGFITVMLGDYDPKVDNGFVKIYPTDGLYSTSKNPHPYDIFFADYGKLDILHKVTIERQLMTEKYLLDKGFIKDFNDLLNEEYFVGPNNQVTVWRNYDDVPSPYDWYVIINKDDNTRGSLDIAYVDEFETFLKLCRVEL